MSEFLDLKSTPNDKREHLRAVLRGRIDTLTSRRGEYKLILLGEAEDLDQLLNAARMQPSERVQVTIEESE